MPNALKDVEYLYKHPEARAKDLMDAFKNKSNYYNDWWR